VHIYQSTSTSPFISSKTLSAAGRNVSINAQSFDVCSLKIEQSQALLYSSIRGLEIEQILKFIADYEECFKFLQFEQEIKRLPK
jgi:hypothetical protein